MTFPAVLHPGRDISLDLDGLSLGCALLHHPVREAGLYFDRGRGGSFCSAGDSVGRGNVEAAFGCGTIGTDGFDRRGDSGLIRRTTHSRGLVVIRCFVRHVPSEANAAGSGLEKQSGRAQGRNCKRTYNDQDNTDNPNPT